jgi:hypothetical protein
LGLCCDIDQSTLQSLIDAVVPQCGHEIPVVLMRLSCNNLDAQIGGMAVFVRPSKVQYFG